MISVLGSCLFGRPRLCVPPLIHATPDEHRNGRPISSHICNRWAARIAFPRIDDSPLTEQRLRFPRPRTIRSARHAGTPMSRALDPTRPGARKVLRPEVHTSAPRRNRPAFTSRFRHHPTTKEGPRSDALRRTGICAAPRRALAQIGGGCSRPIPKQAPPAIASSFVRGRRDLCARGSRRRHARRSGNCPRRARDHVR